MITHTVQQGDTLWKISKAYGISLEALIAANPQIPNPDKIDVGMQVMVPKGGATMPATIPIPAPTPVPTTMPIGQHEMPPATPPVGAAHLDQMMPTTMPTAPEAPAEPTPFAGPPLPEPAYPSVPKWEGLWKYVVKNGDSLFKIAKQVGVTLEQLKAANPQVPNPDKIYPGQVLNIPSSGLKKSGNPGNPGYSLKEQLTAPMGVSPLFPKEILTQPKEMAPMETPISAPPVLPMPAMPAPMPHPFEINANLNFAPHKEVNKETNIGNFAHHNQYQQAQAVSPAATGPTVAKQEMDPAWHHHMMQYYAHMAPYMHMYYVPVKMKKKHYKCGCHKHHKCGCHKHHHKHHAHLAAYHQHLMMLQHMGTQPKTFYREED